MRFAEKMLLNAKFYGLAAHARHDALGNRCALGLVEEGEIRRDIVFIHKAVIRFIAAKHAEAIYPWLETERVALPCICRLLATFSLYNKNAPNDLIAHIFDFHVMGDKTWTLERLADWIDSIDPTPRTLEVEAVESIAIREEQTVGR